MAQGKQAKVLTNAQITSVLRHLETKRDTVRNQVILLLTVKAGLRAKEVAALRWSAVLSSDGKIGEFLELTDRNSKGHSGRIIPLNKILRKALSEWLSIASKMVVPNTWGAIHSRPIICTSRSMGTSSQVIVNALRQWYAELGFVGASSHSGRRTFITNAAKQVFHAGGSMRDVQELAGHKSLVMTQRYIEGDANAKRRLVDLV